MIPFNLTFFLLQFVHISDGESVQQPVNEEEGPQQHACKVAEHQIDIYLPKYLYFLSKF